MRKAAPIPQWHIRRRSECSAEVLARRAAGTAVYLFPRQVISCQTRFGGRVAVGRRGVGSGLVFGDLADHVAGEPGEVLRGAPRVAVIGQLGCFPLELVLALRGGRQRTYRPPSRRHRSPASSTATPKPAQATSRNE